MFGGFGKSRDTEGKRSYCQFAQYFGIEPLPDAGCRDPLELFMRQFGGRSFGNGLFKVFGDADLEKWHGIAASCFPALRGRFKLFGYDWLGRCFAVDLNEAHENEVLLLEIGTLEILGIGKDILGFANEEIPTMSEACLASGVYEEWLESNEPVPPLQCAGYRIPLFLGGEDELSNLEVSDMEVYWDMTDQLWEAVKDLPEGTKIGNISFE